MNHNLKKICLSLGLAAATSFALAVCPASDENKGCDCQNCNLQSQHKESCPMTTINLAGRTFIGHSIPLEGCNLLLIQGDEGLLGCGYFSIEAADKFGHALAIVTGVTTCDDMLTAKVVKVSKKAAEMGVVCGMTGQEALLQMNRHK